MAAREPTEEEKHLVAVRKIDSDLAKILGSHSLQAITLTHKLLQRTETTRRDPRYLAQTLREGLKSKTFNSKNLSQILPALHQIATAGSNPRLLAFTLREGLASKAFNAKNLPQILSMLNKTATAGHNPDILAWTLHEGLESKAFDKENLPEVIELASHYAAKGKDPAAIAVALQKKHIRPTRETLQALKEAEPHILRAYAFIHDVQTLEDHRKVSAPLFAYVFKTHKTMLPKIGKKAYWSHVKIYANQLKAHKTRIKVT